MQWTGWIYRCDHKDCTHQKITTTTDPVEALAVAVRDGWMPGVRVGALRPRIFCPDHIDDAKVPTR